MNAIPIRYSVSDRPVATPDGSVIPSSFVIYNAPRPLFGHLTWQGPFLTGIFYAAVDPLHRDGAVVHINHLTEMNQRDGAVIVQYVDREVALSLTRSYLLSCYPDQQDMISNTEDDWERYLLDRFITLIHEGEVTL